MLEEGMGIVRRPARVRQWLTRVAEVSHVSEGLESWLWADLEKMGSYSSLEGSGWHGAKEGTGSKCREAVEWMDGELKEMEQPLLHSSRWTADQRASNTLRWHKLQMGLGLGLEGL